MAVSGFFIEVFKELASALVEKIDGFIRNENEKKQIEQKLNEHFDRYFKEQYEYLPMSNEFDIQSLHEWLLENLYKRVAICFLADTSAERNYYKDSLIRNAYAKTDADTKEKKQGVHAYVDSFLKTFEHYNFFQKINEMDQYLFNQQTEEIKTIIQSEREKLADFIRYRGSFAEFIDSILLEPLISEVRFHYLNPEIGFVRRDEQFKVLDDFLEREEDLLSLAITGFGGIGKSKLLYHYILELNNGTEWKAVKLNNFHVDKLYDKYTEWHYPKNLLLVFDYATEKSEKIGKWLQAVCQSRSRPKKMRIVFLERQGLIEVNEQIILPLWYQNINKESGRVLETIQYELGNGFYELPLFTKDEMFQVMDMHPELEDELPQTIKESIYDKIVSFSDDGKDERFNTPLIALLLVDAHVNKKNIPDSKKLMEYVIERNKDSLERFFPDSENKNNLVDAVERLLVYATATGGWDLTELSSFLDNDRELLENTLEEDELVLLLNYLNGGTQDHLLLEPLRPDIIGEFFVLNFVNRRQRSKICKKMINACWEKPREFVSFLNRCTRSYLGEFPHLVFDEKAVLFQGTNPFTQAIVLYGMTTSPDTSHRQKAVDHIEKLYHEQNKPKLAEAVAEGFAMALVNLSTIQEKTTITQTIEKLKALSNEWSHNPEIASEYAMGLFNLSYKQEEVEARKTIDELKVFSEQWSENPEIAFNYAKSLVNYSAKQEEVEARKTIDELKVFSDQWSENSDIALCYAISLVNLSTKQEQADTREATVGELKALSDYWIKNPEIALRYSIGLFNLSNKQEKVEARNTVDKLKTLSEQWLKNPEIALEYAKSLVNLSNKQEERVARETISELKTLNEQWSENPGIALMYANGIVNLSYIQGSDTACQTISELKELSDKWDRNPEIALRYASGLFNLSNKQEEVEACKTINKLKELSDKWDSNPEIALRYASGLFNLSNKQEKVEARKTINKLKELSDKWSENLGIALEYAKSLVNLSNKQKERVARETISELKTLNDRWSENPEIALEYAKGLVNLSYVQGSDTACQTISELKELSDKWDRNPEIALRYASGLFNLSNKQDEDEARQTIDKLKAFSGQCSKNPKIAIVYAESLFNLSIRQDEVAARRTIDELKVFSGQWYKKYNIALLHAASLVNLSAKQEGAIAHQTVDELKAIYNQHPKNLKIAFEYAKGLFNLLVKQEGVAARQTVDELLELCSQQPQILRIMLQFVKNRVNHLRKQKTPDALRAKTNLELLIQNLETPGNS